MRQNSYGEAVIVEFLQCCIKENSHLVLESFMYLIKSGRFLKYVIIAKTIPLCAFCNKNCALHGVVDHVHDIHRLEISIVLKNA